MGRIKSKPYSLDELKIRKIQSIDTFKLVKYALNNFSKREERDLFRKHLKFDLMFCNDEDLINLGKIFFLLDMGGNEKWSPFELHYFLQNW